MKFEVFTEYRDYAQQLNFYVFHKRPDGRVDLCVSIDDNMEFVAYEPGDEIDRPTFKLKGPVVKPFLQEMANALKKIGIKAEGDPVLENELSAVKYHLEDMRALALPAVRLKLNG